MKAQVRLGGGYPNGKHQLAETTQSRFQDKTRQDFQRKKGPFSNAKRIHSSRSRGSAWASLGAR